MWYLIPMNQNCNQNHTTQNHTVNDTDLNKIYAFDKIAKLLSDNKFEVVTDSEEVRGLHRDSKTDKISEYVYATFPREIKYKLNLTSDEVWELFCYVLEGMDKEIVPERH